MKKHNVNIITESGLSYHEMVKHIESKYDVNIRDYDGVSIYRNQCKIDTDLKFGENGWYTTNRDKATKEQIEASEYYNSLKPFETKKYLDYWHILIDSYFSEVRNDAFQYWSLSEMNEDEDLPEWVREITKLFYDEFKDDLDNDGGLNVYISW